MYQEVHTHNIAERAYAPEVADLLRRFERSTRADFGGAPFEDFSHELLSFCSRDIMIMAPVDGDYVYEHFGRDIARNVGGDRTGARVSGMAPNVSRFTIACYDQVLATGKPLYSIHRAVKTVRVSLWERLVLPTTRADGERRLIVFSKPLHFREELLTTVLDTSPAGIVALRAVRDDEGDIDRTVIITANRRAAAMAGTPDGTLVDSDGRRTLPFLADETVWRRCLYVMELRRGDMFETCHMLDGREIWLQIALAPLGDGLVMTLTDISELKLANLTLQSRAATLALEIGKERATRRALSHELGQREEREQELRRLAETDPLTTLLNRRSLIEKANAEIAAAAASGQDTSLFIIDLDHFKQVNDTHGHPAGDAVIRAFADFLLGQMRTGQDLVSRLGGEEFAVLLPRTGAREARRIAERLHRALRRTHLPVSETLDLQVTASIGVATRHADEDFNAFVARADKQLYRAKNEGRDCIRSADDEIAAAAA